MAEDFVPVKGKKTTKEINGDYTHSTFANTPENLRDLTAKYKQKTDLIRDSKLFAEIDEYLVRYTTLAPAAAATYATSLDKKDDKESVDPRNPKWTLIKCLALGSPSHEPAALFQLALLQLLSESLKIGEITSYDPAYTDLDREFLRSVTKHKIAESAFDSDNHSHDITSKKKVLYYMPHVPISLLEEIFTRESPVYLVSNDVTVYGDKWSDSEFFEKYPNTARISNMIVKSDTKEKEKKKKGDLHDDKVEGESSTGFQIVSNRKKSKNRKKFIPPVVDYQYDKVYYDTVDSVKFLRGNDFSNPWNESFGFLSFIGLITKNPDK